MRRRWLGPVVAVLAIGVGACTQVVPGAASALPPTVGASAVPPGPGAPRGGLDVDVLPDECLLNAAEIGALVGQAVRPPAQGSVARGDGSSSSACVAEAGSEPVAMINVYAVRSGVPADHVRATAPGARRDLAGVGEAAAVVSTQTGPTLQLATARYLVTILVAGRSPQDEQWRTAAAAALSRLPA